MVFLVLALLFKSMPGWAQTTTPLDTLLSPVTRLLVFTPHPDDETLGAGGLIQRVQRLGGQVQVVLMTNGDGYADGVEMAGSHHPPCV